MRLLIIALAVACLMIPAHAFDLRSARSVSIAEGTVVDDDLIASGTNVDIAGEVDGNALVAGRTVNVSGPVDGLLGAAGGTVIVEGFQQTVNAAGGSVVARSLSARNAALAGGSIDVDADSDIEIDLLVAGGDMTLRGTIGRHLRVAGGNMSIGANVGGNVYANGGEILILPEAVIQGDLIYESPTTADIAEGAVIQGQVVPRIRDRTVREPGRLVSAIFGFAAFFALGAVLVGLFPRWVVDAAARIILAPGWTVLWGLIVLIVAPFAAVLAMITLVGIPVGIIILLAYVISILISIVMSGIAVGALLLRERTIWLQLLLGLAIIFVLGAIPILGVLVWIAVILFGLGAVWSSFLRRAAPAES